MTIDPAEITKVEKAVLLETYQELGRQEEEIAAEKMAIRMEILDRMKLDAEVWGNFSVTKVKRPNYKGVKMDTAKELGAVCEAIDTKMLSKLYNKGVKIEGLELSIYPLIKSLEVQK